MKSILLLSALGSANVTAPRRRIDGRNQRGFSGISSQFTDFYWPIRGCKLDRHCWASSIKKMAGWKQSKARNLQCQAKTGKCECAKGWMDANDDPNDGCELRIRENKCPFGACENHGAELGDTCSGWNNLVCQANGCCDCQNGYNDAGYCLDTPSPDTVSDHHILYDYHKIILKIDGHVGTVRPFVQL